MLYLCRLHAFFAADGFLPYHSISWHILFIQEQENAVSIYHWFDFRLFTVCDNMLEALTDFIRHRYYPCAACRFGIFNHITHIPCPLKLMIDTDLLFLKINIRERQSAKFRNTKPCLAQHEHSVIIPFVMLIILDKL